MIFMHAGISLQCVVYSYGTPALKSLIFSEINIYPRVRDALRNCLNYDI